MEKIKNSSKVERQEIMKEKLNEVACIYKMKFHGKEITTNFQLVLTGM